jgi:hypothetical protein
MLRARISELGGGGLDEYGENSSCQGQRQTRHCLLVLLRARGPLKANRNSGMLVEEVSLGGGTESGPLEDGVCGLAPGGKRH